MLCTAAGTQDPEDLSCAAAFNHSDTARVVERDGKWHHLAVTWTTANDGLTQIFLDGAASHGIWKAGRTCCAQQQLASAHWQRPVTRNQNAQKLMLNTLACSSS